MPLKKWINYDLKEMIFDYLKKGCYSENFINRKFIDELLYKKVKISEEKRAKILWTMFCLEVWKKSVWQINFDVVYFLKSDKEELW